MSMMNDLKFYLAVCFALHVQKKRFGDKFLKVTCKKCSNGCASNVMNMVEKTNKKFGL